MPSPKTSTMLSHHLLDRLGDRNPQLLRELKGRLKKLPVLFAVGLSLLFQLAVIVAFSLALPGPVQSPHLHLNTYPQLVRSDVSQLSPQMQKEFLSQDSSARTELFSSGVFISAVETRESVRGDKAGGLEAAAKLRVGDRLLSIDGEPTSLSLDRLKQSNPNYGIPALLDDVRQQVTANQHRQPSEQQKRIGTTVELTLYRPGRGQFTVHLPRIALSHKMHRYCLIDNKNESCNVVPNTQYYQVDWAKWYGDIFPVLTLPFTFLLMGIGTFLLANDLAEETHRGTLNFLRLSPRSSRSILSGKLLGVPICLYLAVGLGLPLHWWVGLHAGYGMGYLLGFDLTVIGQTLIFYCLALLLSLSISSRVLLSLQPWLLSAGVLLFQFLTYISIHTNLDWWVGKNYSESTSLIGALLFSPITSLVYFTLEYLPVRPEVGADLHLGVFAVSFTEYTILALAHACGWCLLLWHGIQRRFRAPNVTILKRQLSYLVSLTFVAILLGFSHTRGPNELLTTDLSALGMLYFAVLAIALTPARQTLKDWVRFRQSQAQTQCLPLWKDLLIGDTSSPVIAIGLNLLLVALLFVSWSLWNHERLFHDRVQILVLGSLIALFVGSILFTVLVSQALLLLPRKKSWLWFGTVSSLSGLAFPTLMSVMAITLLKQPPPIEKILGMQIEVAVFAIPLSLLGMTITVMTFVHIRQLRLVGRSDSQPLLQKIAVFK